MVVCVCACMCACMRACMHACMCACVHVCWLTKVDTCIMCVIVWTQMNVGCVYFMFGGVSKMIATVITYPVQVIQTRSRVCY